MAGLFDGLQHFMGVALAFFYELAPSFGISIILLTVMINIALFPLTLRQTRATRAFQAIQPEIRRLQKEYKDDKETLQRELMQTQKEAGATPGGCLLPMIIQLPIWWALFRVFRNVALIAQGADGVTPVIPADSALLKTIEAGDTRFLGMGLGTTMSEGISAGFVAAIPYVALLITMISAQYAQQWYAQRSAGSTRVVGDRTGNQQIVTRAMPLFIGFISWRFPAGLVLYWTTSNLVRLGQQHLILKVDGLPVQQQSADLVDDRPMRPPSKKRPDASKKKKGRRRGKRA